MTCSDNKIKKNIYININTILKKQVNIKYK